MGEIPVQEMLPPAPFPGRDLIQQVFDDEMSEQRHGNCLGNVYTPMLHLPFEAAL